MDMKNPELTLVADGLRFPEGPVWLKNGSIALVEIERRTVSLVSPDGKVEVISQHTGGPNGLAVGPDGAFYVCNSGGFDWEDIDGLLIPVSQAKDYSGGRIERVDPATGKISVLYDSCDGHPLRGPNDLVFDPHGGFYFTDLGKVRKRDRDNGGLYYAKADGSKIVEVAHPVSGPNGCGLSPDGKTFYAVELEPSRLWAYEIISPGVVKKTSFPHSLNGGRLVCGLPGFQGFDSLAVDSAGRICVGTIWDKPQITVISPAGEVVREVPMPEAIPTNICFGGSNYETAFITLSGTGKLVSIKWDVPGLRLNYEI